MFTGRRLQCNPVQGRATHMNQVDGVSDIELILCGFEWRRAQKRDNGHCLSSGALSRMKLSPVTHPDASHFSCSHVPLVPFQLLTQCWSPEGMSLHKSLVYFRPFKRRCLRILQFLLPPQLPPVFTARSYGDLSVFLALEPQAGWSGVGLASLVTEVYLPMFIRHTWVWDHLFHISASPTLLPIWMNVTSLIFWLLDFHPAQFFWWFWLIVVL